MTRHPIPADADADAKALPDTPDGWRTFFGRYEDIVLVANSDAVDAAALTEGFGAGTLFVFFNKTYKVLGGPFARPALLVARSSAAGANIVYRREVAAVVRPFAGPEFAGILNLCAAGFEAFSAGEAFQGQAVGFLDLSDTFTDFYPPGRVPTSGFALALWLAEQGLAATVHLAGFSARRSERWKLFKDHDWTFEQTAQRLLHRAGRLRLVGTGPETSPLARLAERFPEIGRDAVALAAAEVLSERLENTDTAVDRLFSLTRWQAALDRAFRALKPATRKTHLARLRGGGGQDGPVRTDLPKSPPETSSSTR